MKGAAAVEDSSTSTPIVGRDLSHPIRETPMPLPFVRDNPTLCWSVGAHPRSDVDARTAHARSRTIRSFYAGTMVRQPTPVSAEQRSWLDRGRKSSAPGLERQNVRVEVVAGDEPVVVKVADAELALVGDAVVVGVLTLPRGDVL